MESLSSSTLPLVAMQQLLVRHCRKAESDLAEKEKELGALRAATASTGPAPPTTTDHSGKKETLYPYAV